MPEEMYKPPTGDSGEPSNERIVIDTEKYNKIATRLYEEHWEEIYKIKVSLPSPEDIAEELRKLPENILRKYYGHGVTRGDDKNQIASVLSLIENSAIQGDVGELGGSPYISAYNTGGFLVILDTNDYLTFISKSREEKANSRLKLVDVDGKEKFALKFKPLAVVCNSHMDSLVKPLKDMFPDTTIIPAREVASFILSHEKDRGV